MSSNRTSLELFRFKRTLDVLSGKKGLGTELISLYVPPGKRLSDVRRMLADEYWTVSNIKCPSTRKNVQGAIARVQQRLKLVKEIPENGFAIFCGVISKEGTGTGTIEIHVIVPPQPLNTYLYRCDNIFHTEILKELLKDKEVYGIILIDSSEALIAKLHGRNVTILKKETSGVSGKTKSGGTKFRDYERNRETLLNAYFRRVGRYADAELLPLENLERIIIGGPGPTKEDFRKGDYLNYTLRNKVIGQVNTGYVDEQGVKEAIVRASETLKKTRYVQEREVVQQFLYHVGRDTGLATYGVEEVSKALMASAVRVLLLSEKLETFQVIRAQEKANNKGDAWILDSTEKQDLIEELAQLGEKKKARVELISGETEEGQMLEKSFGGIAAVLRFRLER